MASPLAQVASPTSANDQKLLSLSKRKPPASTTGLLTFMSNGQNFDGNEKERQHETSPHFHHLVTAIEKCKGIRSQVVQAHRALSAAAAAAANSAAGETPTTDQLRANHQMKTGAYSECLAFHTCPTRWREYQACWSGLSRVPLQDLRELAQDGQLPMVCQAERNSLERCIGSFVSSAVRASAKEQHEDSVVIAGDIMMSCAGTEDPL